MIFIFEMHFIRYAYLYCILQISEYGTVIPKYRFESETLFYGSMKTTWQIVYSGFCDKSVFSVSGAGSFDIHERKKMYLDPFCTWYRKSIPNGLQI